MHFVTVILLHFCLIGLSAVGAEINLVVSQKTVDRDVEISVANHGPTPTVVASVSVEFNGRRQAQFTRYKIEPGQTRLYRFTIRDPRLPGSYPLVTTVFYYNQGLLFSLPNVGVINHQTIARDDPVAEFHDVDAIVEGEILLRDDTAGRWKIVLPDEIEIVRTRVSPNEQSLLVRSRHDGFRNVYPLYAYRNSIRDGVHHLMVLERRLTLDSRFHLHHGRLPTPRLHAATFIFFALSVVLLRLRVPKSRHGVAIAKYSARLFLIFGCYNLLRHGASICNELIALTDIGWITSFLVTARDNFSGGNYRYFFKYFVDAYWYACLLICLPYSYFLDHDTNLQDDKYAAFLTFIYSLPLAIVGKSPLPWKPSARLGFLTVCVKIFYIPLLTSWVINNAIHQTNLTRSFDWNLTMINAYVLALFMFVDTIVFGAGYTIESPKLKNKIRSVEPTLLGWVVCLWCYPPFNTFSFRMFDMQLFDFGPIDWPGWIRTAALLMVTVGWGVFAWASIALGWKASNLTNRGIITSGPYRYCRHPAYTVKIMVWVIQAIFFAQHSVGLLWGFVLVYYLRAWTEERHLSQDPDYVDYKAQVKWRFIPGVV